MRDKGLGTLAAAVRKAGRKRLLADMAHAAWIVEQAQGFETHERRAAYVLGAIAASASATVRACLWQAFAGVC